MPVYYYPLTRWWLWRAVVDYQPHRFVLLPPLLQNNGVPVEQFVATGGLAHNLFYRQVLADVLQVPITVSPCTNGPALGAAMYGASATGLLPGGMVRLLPAGSACA